MDFFESTTQFDDCYKEIGSFSSERSACPFFSILTAYRFLNDTKNITSEIHENNIDCAIINYLCKNIKGHMTFEQMISYTSIKPSQIEATSVEMIENNIIGYDNIFKSSEYDRSYAIIFLKNSKFFVVLVEPKSNKFHIRDCHSLCQYSFDGQKELINFLNVNYEFDKDIKVDDQVFYEFSNIEFIVLDEKFKIDLECDIAYQFPKKSKNKKKFEQDPIDTDFEYYVESDGPYDDSPFDKGNDADDDEDEFYS
ncbi:MAG: hypothetical protein Edafosvirus10_37 [Edafosvirus sp.]|uniref:Uncharacterized protein n=1 Tax=Edafosvirus sp. TaxID=2487765 RepID=A0A3G4ZTY5_9VIRU|nr:MAG: hypothetical protein Edafosvirus10_37 [Edafosvirus sp.]